MVTPLFPPNWEEYHQLTAETQRLLKRSMRHHQMGKLSAFPAPPRKKPNLVCLYESDGIARLALFRNWSEIQVFQADQTNSKLVWYFIQDWTRL